MLAIPLALGLGACATEKVIIGPELSDAVETAKEACSGLVLTLAYHDLAGHASLYKQLGVGYDFAIKVGPIESSTQGVTSDWGGMPAGIFGKAELSEEQMDSLRISGLQATQDLYYKINKNLNESEHGEYEGNNFDHWMALFAGTDFMSYYVRDRFVSERGGLSDVSGLLERGYEKDIDGAFIANIIGNGPDLVWHLARGMGLEMSKPEIYRFRIPGTSLEAEVRPTAYMDQSNRMLAPGFRAEIKF